MTLISITELLSAVFVGISTASQFYSDDGSLSSRRLRLCSAMSFAWLLVDGLAYVFEGPVFGTYAIAYVVNLLAFTMGSVTLIAFMSYAEAYIREQTSLGRWTFRLPMILTAACTLAIASLFVSGKIILFEEERIKMVGNIPPFFMAIFFAFLFYTFLIAFLKRRFIGARAVTVIGIYSFLPAVAVALTTVIPVDLSVLAGGIAVTVVAELLQSSTISARRREAEAALEMLGVANQHEKLRADALSFVQNNDDLEAFVDFLFGRVLKLYDCDQVIYRDVEDHLILKERPGTPRLDFSLCRDCPHFAFDAPVYADGFTVVDDSSVGYRGFPIHPGCRVKASLTYLVREGDRTFGYVALHYVDRTHKFTDEEKDTFDRIAKFMSMVVSRRKQRKAIKALAALSNQCISVFDVDLKTGLYETVKHPDTTTVMDREDRRWDLALGRDFAAECVGETRKVVERLGSVDFLRKELADADHREYAYVHRREVGGSVYRRCTALALERDAQGNATRALVDFMAIDDNQAKVIEQGKLIERQQTLTDGLAREYHTVWTVDGKTHEATLFRTTGVATVGAAVDYGRKNPDYDGSIEWYVNTFVDEADRERVRKATTWDAVVKNTPDVGVYTVTYRRHPQPDVTDYHQMCFAKAVSPSGKTDYLFAYRDVDKSIREQIEREERQRRKLEEAEALDKANKAKSYFFSMVSHDIRTPLNAIIGYAELLKLGMADEAERDKAIDSVLVSGHTLLELINDVLDLSKLEAGKMEILPEPVDSARLVEEVADAFRATIGGKPVQIRTAVAPMPWLKLDPQRVRQILFNLVGNAVKFTDEGHIEVRAEYVRGEGGRGVFRFAVEDTGCGISETDQERVAQPYVQVSVEASRGKGTGLGLAICKQLVARMGGKIDLKSALRRGTTFTITLPDVEEAPEATRTQLTTEQRIRQAVSGETIPKGRVLVVDDMAMNRMVLKTMLKKFGVTEIEDAENGFRALEKLQGRGPFDFVLTDMWMPGMDGERFVREVRKNPAWKELPVYAVTADVEAQKGYVEMGFNGILLKPLTMEKLKEFFESRKG